MGALLKLRAKEQGIAPQVLASSSDLSALARGYYEESGLTHGWKKRIIGDELIDLLEGRICLSIQDGNLNVLRK